VSKRDDVKNKVSIPMYFYNIIVPQLGSYYSEYPVDFDARPVACCPLHDEDTPSMRYYEETNSFYCFGCRRGGDIIALHRYFTERWNGYLPTFEEAVDFLYDYFIKGNENAKNIKKTPSLIEDVELSSNVDLIQYCRYTDILEKQLAIDSDMSYEIKKTIWKALDSAEILVTTNMANAKTAMNYIKQVVRDNVK
jgi:hypothetical protein